MIDPTHPDLSPALRVVVLVHDGWTDEGVAGLIGMPVANVRVFRERAGVRENRRSGERFSGQDDRQNGVA